MEKHHGSSKKGAVSPIQVSNQDINLIKDMKDKINSKMGVHHQSYEIISLSGGQESSGTNKFFHLRGKPGHKEYTITVFVPVGEKPVPQISEACAGLKPHHQGFSQHQVQH